MSIIRENRNAVNSMYYDFHCHIFNKHIIANVGAKSDMVKELSLNVKEATANFEPASLQKLAQMSNVKACVILPTAAPEKVVGENDRCYRISVQHDRIISFSTLHPAMHGLEDEMRRTIDRGIRGFKFSSFSQKFDLRSAEVSKMLVAIEKYGNAMAIVPIVVFDTFCKADVGFGADPDHLTTPDRLSEVYPKFPGINFIGAHMGGLMANFDDLKKYLEPASNFYLDTSNAAHTLKNAQLVELLKIHGSSHVLFGTDWPWFTHAEEIPLIRSLLDDAGYSDTDCNNVFLNNALRLMQMAPTSSRCL